MRRVLFVLVWLVTGLGHAKTPMHVSERAVTVEAPREASTWIIWPSPSH